MNTEDLEINKIPFLNTTAYHWENNDNIYFLWNKENISYCIVANIAYDEVIKISENISII